MIGWSNTSVTARRSALAPSSTTRIGRVTSSPRSRSPVSTSVTTVAFSVAPSAKASGTLVPSMVMPRATTQVWAATRMPSTMSATRSIPVRSWASRSARACSVRATNRRDTADLEVPELAWTTWVPTGSSPAG
jgi:hypothetical protein